MVGFNQKLILDCTHCNYVGDVSEIYIAYKCDPERIGGNVPIASVNGLYGNTISYPLPGPAGTSTRV